MSSRDVYTPPEPPWLLETERDQRTFLQSLREPEPVTNPPDNPNAPSWRPSLAAALIAARSEMQAIAKDSVNPHFKSKYASLDAIIEHALPILNRHGLTVIQGTIVPDSDATGKLIAFTVRTTLLHVGGESLSSDVVMPLAKSDPQGAGGALTYGRRYGLSALLCLATDEDDDGNAASRTTKATRAQNAKATIAANAPKSAGPLMTVGPNKGKALADLDTAYLVKSLEWCKATDEKKFATLIANIETVLDTRRDAETTAEQELSGGDYR